MSSCHYSVATLAPELNETFSSCTSTDLCRMPCFPVMSSFASWCCLDLCFQATGLVDVAVPSSSPTSLASHTPYYSKQCRNVLTTTMHSVTVAVQNFLDSKTKMGRQAKYVTSLSELTKKTVNHVHWQFGERSLDT